MKRDALDEFFSWLVLDPGRHHTIFRLLVHGTATLRLILGRRSPPNRRIPFDWSRGYKALTEVRIHGRHFAAERLDIDL